MKHFLMPDIKLLVRLRRFLCLTAIDIPWDLILMIMVTIIITRINPNLKNSALKLIKGAEELI